MLWYRVTFHQVVGTAFVQRPDPCTFFKSTNGHVAEEIVIVLVLDGVQNGDCFPDTRQDFQFKYQRKQKMSTERTRLQEEIA